MFSKEDVVDWIYKLIPVAGAKGVTFLGLLITDWVNIMTVIYLVILCTTKVLTYLKGRKDKNGSK